MSRIEHEASAGRGCRAYQWEDCTQKESAMANEHRKMTVARALKEKERILRRLAEAKTLFEGVNCVKVGEVRDADPEAVYGDVQSLQK